MRYLVVNFGAPTNLIIRNIFRHRQILLFLIFSTWSTTTKGEQNCTCAAENIVNNTLCNNVTELSFSGASQQCGGSVTLLSNLLLPDLRRLDWHQTGLAELFNHTLTGLAGVERLNLSGNLIDFVDADAFRALGRLAVLDLSRNQIDVLPPTVCHFNAQLTHIYLAHNRLIRLELVLNTRSTALVVLDARSNALENFDLKVEPGPQKQQQPRREWQTRSQNHNLTVCLDYNNLTR